MGKLSYSYALNLLVAFGGEVKQNQTSQFFHLGLQRKSIQIQKKAQAQKLSEKARDRESEC